MRVVNLDGQTVEWRIKNTCKTRGLNKSALHIQARDILQELFPTSVVLEEVKIPVHERKCLFLDFYVPLYRLAVEVQGQQHNTQVAFFHTPQQFQQQLRNDNEKAEWCELNHIKLIHLNWNNPHEWRQQLQSAQC